MSNIRKYKLRHFWVQDGILKKKSKCVKCGVKREQGKKDDGLLNTMYITLSGEKCFTSPDCVDNSEFL